MIYRLSQRVRPKLKILNLVGLGLSGSLLLGLVATVYADAHGPVAPRVLPEISHATSPQSPSLIKQTNASGSTHKSPAAQALPPATGPVATSLRLSTCPLFPLATLGLAGAHSPELRKLAQYEQLCNGAFVARDSFFVSTPTTVLEAQSAAASLATILKEYAAYNVKPLVFIEPDTNNGTNIDLNAYRSGAYDAALDAYFAGLKANGITDSMMGMWVALPEGNIPVWTSVDPATFVADVTKTLQFQKKYFPASQAAILLDSESYSSGASWGNGHYVSLLPYIQGIPKGLVDSFGIQGFPWAPPANQGGAVAYDPRSYLRIDFAAEAARALGITNIWFNTGTFNQMYTTSQGAQTVSVTPAQRQVMLDGVLAQAKNLKAQGFSVAIHLFAENKSKTTEAIDWSYWANTPGSDQNTAVLTTFVHDATVAQVSFWLFDTTDH